MRFTDFLKTTVLLTAGEATALGAVTVVSAASKGDIVTLVFSLAYWIFDTGGPWIRSQGTRPYPDFAFSQQMSPELAPPGWRPMYVDYMVLGLNTSAAFSPTDVMPMARWAKLAMSAQSLLSLTVVALVVARAVNAFT